jgi:hypothetical protein
MSSKLGNGASRNTLLVLYNFCDTSCDVRIKDFRLRGFLDNRHKVRDDMGGDLHIRFHEGSIEGEQ